MPHDDSEPAKGLAVLEDGNLDIGNPILRDRTSQEVGYHHRTRCECAVLGLDRQRIAAWQGLPRLGERVQELLAICISDQCPGISPGRERAARLSLERIEIVVEQRR